ncbi:ABC transporter ATP-binding protein [Pelagibacteraceae bacterium]|nr:ABC transporter ATP-binding protein [Pelagibacteraceae bacterium]
MNLTHGESVTFKNVEKYYNKTVAVKDFNLDIKSSEFLTLLGPSGSGKTTVLNMIAGFIQQSSGSILIGKNSIENLPTEKRNVGMVFQSYSLFPHMNIFENVAFPLKMRNEDKKIIKEKVSYALNLVNLDGVESRKPNELSGGQRQRIAFARAIVFKPKVLLMDEPLGALDLKLREKMQIEIKNYHKEINCTIIYVTHDQGEALTLSDRIVIMNKGKIVQIDNPKNIYDNPLSKFAANFIGESNILNIDSLKLDKSNINYENKKFISIRPEKLKLVEKNFSQANDQIILNLKIDQIIFLGDFIKYICNDENNNTIILKKARIDNENNFNISDNINVYFDISECSLLKE